MVIGFVVAAAVVEGGFAVVVLEKVWESDVRFETNTAKGVQFSMWWDEMPSVSTALVDVVAEEAVRQQPQPMMRMTRRSWKQSAVRWVGRLTLTVVMTWALSLGVKMMRTTMKLTTKKMMMMFSALAVDVAAVS